MFKSHNIIGAGFPKGVGLVNRYYGTKRLTKVQRDSFSVTPNLHQIIIGCCLGDLYIYKDPRGVNPMLRFEQGLIHEEYILYLYNLFKGYCSSAPKSSARKPDSRTGKVYSSITFNTYSLPCFNYYYELLYVNGVKRIPLNIGDLLTPVGLAYWAMDDGSAEKSGFLFHTNSVAYATGNFIS
jgi:hypothetical protein